MSLRTSTYPMLEVEDALVLVMKESESLPSVSVPLLQCCHHRSCDDVKAVAPFPAFPVSIMDGYAVCSPIKAGTYPVQSRILAGDADSVCLQPGEVVYITTGARMPEGADAVIKVEDTADAVENNNEQNSNSDVQITSLSELDRRMPSSSEKFVKINVDVEKAGVNVRQIGSDIAVGEVLVSSGQILEPAEVGLLASAGIKSVNCYARPKVGIMSTGTELVDPINNDPLEGSQIWDSNRAALLASFIQSGCEVIDLGIIGDTYETLQNAILDAVEKCDVIITSGGVSMGAADLVKPLLAELGTIHFGRVRMKPGKPTTFASVNRVNVTNGRALVFGLPGNPASCLVTKALFVDPCLRRLQGASSEGALHTQMKATLVGGSIALDPERAEYHRGVVSVGTVSGRVEVISTGNQRSSRLLSMRANALICLARGTGVVAEGQVVTVIMLNDAIQSVLPPPTRGINNFHKNAAMVDTVDTIDSSGITSMQHLVETSLSIAPVIIDTSNSTTTQGLLPMRVGILTVSDRASVGTYEDKSGPEIREQLVKMELPFYAPQFEKYAVVSDEPQLIRQKIIEWIDSSSIDLLLTTGGTGFGKRDNTPEAIRPLLHREAPGIAQALLAEGLKFTPLAVLSRPIAGTRGDCFIATLPGSVKAIKENMRALKPLLPRIMELVISNTCGAHVDTGGVKSHGMGTCDCCK
jgi:gephyrin